jgi:hypothetical protein
MAVGIPARFRPRFRAESLIHSLGFSLAFTEQALVLAVRAGQGDYPNHIRI